MRFLAPLLLLFIMSLSSFGSELALYSVINEELKAILSSGFRDDQVEYRVLELMAQKANILKKAENALYLKESTQGVKKSKDSYFSKSKKAYRDTVVFAGQSLAKRPKHMYKAQIYFLIGHMDSEFSKGEKSKQYYEQVIALGPGQGDVYYKAAAGIADIEFNKKNFENALRHYEIAIKSSKDKLLSKYFYQMAWCKLKLNDTSSAVQYLRKSLWLSRNGYYDISDQVRGAIGYFYFQDGRINEAIAFFRKETPGEIGGMEKLATIALENDKLTYIPHLIAEMKQVATQKGSSVDLSRALLVELKYYRYQKDFNNHLNTAKRLTQIVQNQSNLKEFADLEVSEIRDFLQLIQLKRAYSGNDDVFKYLPQVRLNQQYYTLLSALDPVNKAEYLFVQGELLYSVKQSEAAKQYYIASISVMDKANKREDYYKKSLDSLAAIYKANQNPKDFDFIFARYLKYYPKDPANEVLLPIKFKNSMGKKEYSVSESVLIKYYQNYPAQIKVAQGMLAELVDAYIQENNTSKIRAWAQKLDSGYLQMDVLYVNKVKQTIGDLALNKALSSTENSNDDIKVSQYKKIYENGSFKAATRAVAALNIADLALSQGESQKAGSWAVKGFQVLTPQESLEFSKQSYSIAQKLALLGDFASSEKLAMNYVQKNCNIDFPQKKDLVEKALYHSLADQASDFVLLKSKMMPCVKLQDQRELNEKLLGWLFEFERYDRYKSNIASLVTGPRAAQIVYGYLSRNYWEKGGLASFSDLENFLTSAKGQLVSVDQRSELQLIKTLKSFEMEVQGFDNESLGSHSVVFSEQNFNNDINNFLGQLQRVNVQADQIQGSGHAESIVRSSLLLSKAYRKAAIKLRQYPFQEAPEEAKQALGQQLNEIALQLEQKSQEKLALTKQIVGQNQIFSPVALKDTPVFIPQYEDRTYRYPASITRGQN